MAQSNVCRSFDKHTLYQKKPPSKGWLFHFKRTPTAFPTDADAQCEGTELVVHTFTSFANAELAWELADANGSTLSTYAGREMQ
jgi:hypothetical protein